MNFGTLIKSFIVAAVLTTSSAGIAQNFPVKPVKLIIPWSPGGGADSVGRLVGRKLGDIWGQPVLVENRPGASGNVGSEAVARAAPDGYTIMLTTITLVTMASLYKSLPFDPHKDFTPITLAAGFPHVLVVNKSASVQSVAELIALAKSKPGRLNYASAGTGSPFHLAAELFIDATQVKITHVPYKGGAPAVTDLIGGQVDLAFANYGNVLPLIKAGRLRALGITTTARASATPDLPTIAESGVPGYEFAAFFGFFAPAGISKEVLGKLYSDIAGVLRSAEVRNLLSSEGADVIASRPEEFSAFLDRETAKWARLIKSAGIAVE